MFDQKNPKKTTTLLLAVTPIPSSTAGGAVRLFNLHHSKGQSMEEGPFVRNCQRRQGPQAWSPRVKSAYLGCHLDMTGPQGQGRGVKLLTTLNVTPALLYYERHAKWLIWIYYTSLFNSPQKHVHLQLFISSAFPFKLVSFSCNFKLFNTMNKIHFILTEDRWWFQHILVITYH